ncbi:hypothetical protein EB796_012225 [Bugula neritina]|uniref:Uncharacterized protein n=1 Tax=Bugula neritina TaxID=10212 RepID=A0A7J7JSX0_BUGNE|nr:hypothetical protein EB796_012225 [Bugula neritina]
MLSEVFYKLQAIRAAQSQATNKVKLKYFLLSLVKDLFVILIQHTARKWLIMITFYLLLAMKQENGVVCSFTDVIINV